MGRLIDADALLSEMGKYSDLSARYKDEYLSGMQQRLETCIELVEDAPTVDAVPVKRGYWIRHDWAEEAEGCLIPNYECSVCHAWKRDESDYCPDCGSDMRGEHEKAD